MKKLLLLPIMALLFACDTDDDGYYNVQYVDSAETLLAVEPQADLNVNDVLYVSAEVPFLLPEIGQSNPVDVLRSTGNAPSFEFSYVLQKQIGNEWEPVDMTGLFVADIGQADEAYYILARTNKTETGYFFRGGIRLTQTGNYRLVFNTNSSNESLATLRSRSTGNNIVLNVYSPIAGTTGGIYTFSVN